MRCYEKNICVDNRDTIDVKLNNECNGSCSFCIESGGYSPVPTDVGVLISKTLNSDKKNVLILGGEPLMYEHLEEYLKGIKPHKENIYLTTNSTLFDEQGKIATMLSKYLTAINLSIHHYDEKINSLIIGCDFNMNCVKKAIDIFSQAGVSVRINCNLIKDGIERNKDVVIMIGVALGLGASVIRFNELQGCDYEYVSAHCIFEDLPKDPYTEGCLKKFRWGSDTYGIDIEIKMTCGLVNPNYINKNKLNKISIDKTQKRTSAEVLYPDGKITEGWISKSKGCHGWTCHN